LFLAVVQKLRNLPFLLVFKSDSLNGTIQSLITCIQSDSRWFSGNSRTIGSKSWKLNFSVRICVIYNGRPWTRADTDILTCSYSYFPLWPVSEKVYWLYFEVWRLSLWHSRSGLAQKLWPWFPLISSFSSPLLLQLIYKVRYES